ncbi:MAG: hypothetical protein SGI74_08615 [Oligoflexia bacterium]|nr:hypothetical protein [Oligoflexia bacterium]
MMKYRIFTLTSIAFTVLTVLVISKSSFGLSVTPQFATSRFIKSAPQTDSSKCVNHVQSVLNDHSKHAGTMVYARQLQLDELTKMRSHAWKIASFSTILFAFSLALLCTLIFWKYIFTQRFSNSMAIALSGVLITVNFCGAFFWVRHSADSHKKYVQQFKANLDDINVEVLQSKGKQARGNLGKFIVKVHSSYMEVPKAYWIAIKDLPKKSRWWTLGWDSVYSIDFELATAQVLKNRFELEAAGMKNALPMIKELCSQG